MSTSSNIERAGVSRRGFLKGMGLTGIAALAGANVVACSPDGSSAGSSDEASAADDASTAPQAETFGYSTTSDWLGTAPEIADSDIVEEIDCDVVVCGGGHAGIQAALAAAEGGAQVEVIEMASEDGRQVKGEDVGHVNSQFLIDHGFGPYDEGEIVQEFVTRSAGRANPEIIRKFVANSGEMFDNMVSLVNWPDDRIKLVTDADPDISPLDDSMICIPQPSLAFEEEVTYPLERGGFKTWPCVVQFMGTIQHESVDGVAALSRLDEFQQFGILQSQDLGANWHYSERAQVLVQDDSGAVTGVITEREDGYVKYNASMGVILCTGDFGANSDMTWNLLTEYREYNERMGQDASSLIGQTDCVGDGHKMACWAGGFIEAGPRGAMSFGGGASGPWGSSPFLWLNSKGERFMNEAAVADSMAIAIRQPLGGFTLVTDQNYKETLKYSSLDHGCANFGRKDYYTELVEDMENVPVGDPEGGSVRMCTVAERMPCTVYAADTLEELGGMLGYEGDTLDTFLASIEHYNELCEAGSDTDYGKTPELMTPIKDGPFYGCGNVSPDGFGGNTGTLGVSLVTVAGINTNDDLQVLDKDYNVIPGLYCAGNVLGGRYGLQYTTPFAGNSVGMAMTHGRVAGKLITGQEVL